MDVVASNISNINTTGFKGSRVTFQELLSQTIRGSSAPTGDRGGLNPIKVGLGMSLASIDTIYTQGGLQATGKSTDLAIQGDGFFILNDGSRTFYTRDGSFELALDGSLVHLATGMKVMGWTADTAGVVDTTQPLGTINIAGGQAMIARATSSMSFRGNVDAAAANGSTSQSVIGIYDSLGNLHTMLLTFTKTGIDTWTWQVTTTEAGVSISPGGPTTITFTTSGQYATTNPPANLSITLANGAASPQAVALDLSAITQLANRSEVTVNTQDGLPAGSLISFNVGGTGDIVGVFSNGLNRKLGQISLARFMNPGGLLRSGQNLYAELANSGRAEAGVPGSGGRGQVAPGFLEMSNVELAQQFTNMIIAQRGFQANSRVISASDEMLQDLVNLKR